MYMYIYIYIYICTSYAARGAGGSVAALMSRCCLGWFTRDHGGAEYIYVLCKCVYIYIYTYVSLSLYIYIYIYTHIGKHL